MLLTQTLTSLPDDVMMTMKLAYYDDGKLYHMSWDPGMARVLDL